MSALGGMAWWRGGVVATIQPTTTPRRIDGPDAGSCPQCRGSIARQFPQLALIDGDA